MARVRAAVASVNAPGKALAVAIFGAFLGLTPSPAARADATVACPFNGKQVQTVVTNSKDGPRSCNAVCVWRYGDIALRGLGGAMLQSGETKTVYHIVAPYPIDAVVGSDINCNR